MSQAPLADGEPTVEASLTRNYGADASPEGLARRGTLSIQRVFRNRGALIGTVILVILVIASALASVLPLQDPTAIDMKDYLKPPSRDHLFGADQYGRDVFSRVLFGGQVTLAASLLGVAIAATGGIALGLFAGYSDSRASAILMRLVDVGLAFPGIMIALAVVAVLGPGMVNVELAVGISLILGYIRLVRAVVLAIKKNEFVEAAYVMGARPMFIVFRHLLPNVAGPIIVLTTSAIGWAIITASSMSFLGLGVSPPTPEWGADLRSAMSYLQTGPWLIAPGVAILLAIVAVNLLGDGLQDALDEDYAAKVPVGPRRDAVQREPSPSTGTEVRPLLRVERLSTSFPTRAGTVRAVDDVSFDLGPGEALGIVGESGSGKSVLARSLLRLVPDPSGTMTDGSVLLDGVDVMRLSERELGKIRGSEIAIVFQDPLSSLNPTLTIGFQLSEGLVLHQGLSRKEAWARAIELLDEVGIPDSRTRVSSYPFELSGGMRQRVMIAMAISCHPKLLIADEPTTALDVTTQTQIMELILRLRRTTGSALLLISHDLGLVAGVVDRVAVMYAGRVVEVGPVDVILKSPEHPYTLALLRSIPRLDHARPDRLTAISGVPPDPVQRPEGCAFHPRCPLAMEICRHETPQLEGVGDDHHEVACWAAGRYRQSPSPAGAAP
jgi:peptide/nickel transport system ATP-binding protein/peptide/nickel transport system permease protein